MRLSRLVPLVLALAPSCALEEDELLPPRAPGHPIAYVSQGLAAQDDIFVLSANAQNDDNITMFTAYDSWPSWSPNGQRIVFESERIDTSQSEIYIITLAGRALVQLTDDTAHIDAQPAWSPLGDRIALVSERDSAGFDIYLMDTLGVNLVRLTTNPGNEVQPAWSPTGGQIAFVNDWDGFAGEVYVMDTLGGNLVNLTNNSASDLTPAWSPDGSKIAFMSNRDMIGFAVWVMDANGANPVKVSGSDPECGVPSWTPDGLRLAFECDADIWVANADGGALTQITRTTNQQRGEAIPRWKPVP